MSIFIKTAAVVLLALVLHIILLKQGKDFSLLLTVTVCCFVAALAIQHLEPVFRFFDNIRVAGNIDSDMLSIILKAVGLGLLSEIVTLICSDAGNAAMGKTLQILASAIILWISLPLLESLITLVEEILIVI